MSETAVIYVRISQDRSGEGAGVARQEEDCRALAARRGWSVADVIVENDTSAAKANKRPGFTRLLQLLDAGQVKVVVAYHLDRLTRNRRETVALIEAAQRAEALLAIVRGSDLDMATPAGRLTADILASVARNEIEVKSDRQRRANLQAAEAGKYTGGRRAFGYDDDGVTPREEEAAAIRDAYEGLLGGRSLRQIAVDWNGLGLRTPQGKRGTGEPSEWTGATVSRCLRKPRYAGLRALRGEVVARAEWPGIVPEDVWHQAQAMMRDPKRRPARGDKRLLTAVALCGVCDATVWAGGGATGRGVYRCRATSGHVIRRREPIDQFITELVIARLERGDGGALFARPAGDAPDMAELAREAEQARARLGVLSEMFGAGEISAAQFRMGNGRVKERLAELESQMAVSDPAAASLAQVVNAPDVRAKWEALPVDTQRQLIDRMMTIRLMPPGRGVRSLDPATVRVTWRVPA